MERFAYPFAPEVAYLFNPSATAINIGEAVKWQGGSATVYDYPMPEPNFSAERRRLFANQSARSSATMGVPGVVRCTSAPTLLADICGVAMETIAASSWGHVGISGVMDVRIAASSNIAKGEPLVVTAGGAFIDSSAEAATATVIHAMALEATITSGTCASAIISAFLPPRPGPLDMLNFSTATTL